MNDDERWLEIAGLILDGQPVAWDTIPGSRGDVSADALRVIAEVAGLHRSGERFDRWGTLAIQEQIGHGTFGDVYRARDATLDRDVALKLVDYTPSATAPDEGRLLARVRHSNVVIVHGAAIHDGRYGIWMEFIRGRTLAAVVREQGPLAPEDVTAIGIDVCRALTAVHESGLLHGDIKAHNVMREDGGRIVVMDFGTGRVVNDGAAGDRLAGTPLYLAPEVLSGVAPDVRADVYSAGVLLYYLLTGAHPVEGSTLDEVRAAHASGVRIEVRSRRPEIPRPLAATIERAIAIEPLDRFDSAAAFEHALGESFAPRARSSNKRFVAMLAASGTIAGLLVGAFALFASRQHLWDRDEASGAPPTHRQITFVGDAYFPTISRDGKFLAYVRAPPDALQSTVFVQDRSGGPPRPVFSGARLSELGWSHDGSELLVSANDQTLIVPRLGGQPRLVGPHLSWRSWSPDDARFAGITRDRKAILFVDSRTGAYTQIPLTGSFASMTGIDWSPTGDLLLFETADAQRRYAIWTIRVDGSHQEKIAESPLPSWPRWSPKGNAIYYFRDYQPRDLMKLPVSDRTGKATGSPRVVLAGLQAGPEFTISTDGQQLAYTREITRENLWVASTTRSGASASDVRQLTSGTTQDEMVSVSPDGRRIAFLRMAVNGENVFVIPIDGGTPTQITFLNSIASPPVWSPDARTIAFVSTDGGQPRIWLVSATGGTPRALNQTRFGGSLSWAPNASILYQESVSRIFQALNPITGEQRPLVGDTFGADVSGAWTSPDNSQVVTYRSRDPLGIWLIPLRQPSHATMLTSLPLSPNIVGSISQSVDALALRGRDVTFVAHMRNDVSSLGTEGGCFVQVTRPNRQVRFLPIVHDQPGQSQTWRTVTIAGRVDGDAERVAIGCSLIRPGQMWVDDVRLQSKDRAGHWQVVPLKNAGFEEADERRKPLGWDWFSPGGYRYEITNANPYSGRHCLTIKSTYVPAIFYPIGWSRDGKSVYAYNVEHSTQIVMIRTDGGEFHPVMELPVTEGQTSGGRLAITPDGQRAVYSARQRQSDVWIAQNFDSGR